jgi:phage host-nuclease inhibitor protein Gam
MSDSPDNGQWNETIGCTAPGETTPNLDVEKELWFHRRDVKYLEWVDAHAAEQVLRIENWRQTTRVQAERNIAFRMESLGRFFTTYFQSDRTQAFVNGVLKVRKQPDKVEITNALDFGEWYEADKDTRHQYVRTRVIQKPDKKAILQHLKETGEELPGVTFVPGEDRFSIDVSAEVDYDPEVRTGSEDGEDGDRPESG